MLSRVFLHGCVLAEILQNATFYLVPQVLYTNIDTKQKLKMKELKKTRQQKEERRKHHQQQSIILQETNVKSNTFNSNNDKIQNENTD